MVCVCVSGCVGRVWSCGRSSPVLVVWGGSPASDWLVFKGGFFDRGIDTDAGLVGCFLGRGPGFRAGGGGVLGPWPEERPAFFLMAVFRPRPARPQLCCCCCLSCLPMPPDLRAAALPLALAQVQSPALATAAAPSATRRSL